MADPARATAPPTERAGLGGYAVGIVVLVLAIVSQYFVPQAWPPSRLVYGSLAGDVGIVYGLPIVVFAVLVGVGPLRRWNAERRRAPVVGLAWYGALGLLALLVTIVLLVVYEIVDPSALQYLERTTPVARAAASDPWLYVGFSFAVGAFEETIFRGWVFGFWLGRARSWLLPAVLSSLLFAALHLYYGTTYGPAAPVVFPTLFLLGFAFAATYRATGGNLVVPALLHGLFDASSFLALVSPAAGELLHYLPMVAGGIVALVVGRAGLSPRSPAVTTRPWTSVGVAPPTWSSAGPGTPAPMAPSDDELRRVLAGARTLAVVGLSDKPERDSNEVARYLRSQGYRIVPVNPAVTEVLGERSYPSLAAIPADLRVDVALVFRRSEAVPLLVDEAIARGIPTVWMQLGVENARAAANGRAHGLTVVENTCSMVTHRRLGIPPVSPRP